MAPGKLYLKLIPDRKFLEDKMQQPYRADEQKFQIVKKGWFFAFYFMAYKLPGPGGGKNNQAALPQCGAAAFMPGIQFNDAIAKPKYN